MRTPTYEMAIRWIVENVDVVDEIPAITAFVAALFDVPDAKVCDDVIAKARSDDSAH